MCKRVFRTGCLVRTGHLILTWGTTLVLLLHDTDLRKNEDKGELTQPVVFGLLVLVSVGLYFIVSLMDPGFVLNDLEMAPPSEEHEEMMPQARARRCGHCLLLQPMRARHCKTCSKCVRRFDHHCPWIENCVGEKNHKWFLLYLTVQLMVLVWGVHIAWSGIVSSHTWKLWLLQNILLLGALVITGVFSGVVTILLGCHLYLAGTNTTTWEFMSYHRISYLKHHDPDHNPFDRGSLCNLWDFFCVCRTVAWEKVHARVRARAAS